MRAGTNGMFYYAGLAFDRGDNAPSAIFVARFMDLNNLEAGDPIGYLDTRIVDTRHRARGSSTRRRSPPTFRAPRRPARIASTQTIGDTRIAARPDHSRRATSTSPIPRSPGQGADEQSVILFSRSTNCGQTWSAPKALSTGSRLVQNAQIAVDPVDGAVYVSWRRFKYLTQDDAVMVVRSTDGGATSARPCGSPGVRPFDQGTTPDVVPDQRLPDDGGRCHRPRLPGVARARPRDGASRSADRRRAHRRLDVHQRDDVDGAAARSRPRASGIS